ncbi:hypothetical protein DAPPUDRAFT_108605 [Daphnia pulex]|uniref:Uncharacterized protein n=1 Tax=Daphnia pulex TaxID=6669 RepID=E9H0N2_DAPPU|nr:hypothetical protein DAPPUDRAFT_108605 [Daphnia pulex]|eukprot:EFX74676.1 hypothetical protein DAPPUDRAFT_108605 [Daphnia pulex]
MRHSQKRPEIWRDEPDDSTNQISELIQVVSNVVYTFCSNGFCEGDCVKCQLFRREESANSCVKEIKNCGPCLPGTEAEDLEGGGKSIYCKPIGNLTTPVIETSVTYWVITAITTIVIVAAAVGAIWKRKHLRDFFRRQKSTNNDNPPPFNPNFNQTPGFPEAINHVVGSSTAPDYSSDGESDDSTGPSSASNRLLHPGETVNISNANPGIYQGVEIDLSEFRRSESSISIEGSPGAQFSSISIDSYNEDEGNVSFAIVVTKTN